MHTLCAQLCCMPEESLPGIVASCDACLELEASAAVLVEFAMLLFVFCKHRHMHGKAGVAVLRDKVEVSS